MSSREPVGHWPLGANRWDHGVDDPSTIEAGTCAEGSSETGEIDAEIDDIDDIDVDLP